MTNTILILIACSTVITSIINAAKPWFKKFAGKYTVTVSVFLAFVLGILAAFSVAPYLSIELNTWILILMWLALGTGSNLFYDLWELVKGVWVRLNEARKAIEEVNDEEAIGFKSKDEE